MESKFVIKKVKSWPIAKLKPHPRQSIFRPHTPREIADLAALLNRDGLNCPVEITPDGYIICGHGRVAAAKHLDWDKIHVWVRHDLAEQGEEAVIQRLIEDNLTLRTLSKLGLGRAFMALKEQEYDSWRAREQEEARGDFRDYLGEVLGCDGTTAERWAKLAVLPAEYDQLIESNLLTQQQAAQIVKKLLPDIRERLGKKLAAIAAEDADRKTKKQNIRAAVDARLGKSRTATKHRSQTRSATVENALRRVVQELPEPIKSFADRVDAQKVSRALLRTLQRKCPHAFGALNQSAVELDQLDVEQISRDAVAVLALLSIADVSPE